MTHTRGAAASQRPGAGAGAVQVIPCRSDMVRLTCIDSTLSAGCIGTGGSTTLSASLRRLGPPSLERRPGNRSTSSANGLDSLGDPTTAAAASSTRFIEDFLDADWLRRRALRAPCSATAAVAPAAAPTARAPPSSSNWLSREISTPPAQAADRTQRAGYVVPRCTNGQCA